MLTNSQKLHCNNFILPNIFGELSLRYWYFPYLVISTERYLINASEASPHDLENRGIVKLDTRGKMFCKVRIQALEGTIRISRGHRAVSQEP